MTENELVGDDLGPDESEEAEPTVSGYHDCDCCGETIIDQRVCDACVKAGCEKGRGGHYDDCQIPQCLDCCDGEGPRASLMNDGKWHSNCDEPCPNAGKSWEAT